jgi:ankyrin repeat protein
MLKEFEQTDTDLLQVLHYINSEGKMPIHFALETNNTRIVNVILSFMSQISYASVHNMQSIFSELINYQRFEEYLQFCPF